MAATIRTFVDNTGLQSAGQCFNEQARGEPDLKGLLQLSLLLVFSDQIVISACESLPIINRSREIRDTLIGSGFEQETIQFANDLGIYEKACQSAAVAASDDLRFGFEPLERQSLIGLAPPIFSSVNNTEQERFLSLVNSRGTEDAFRMKMEEYAAQKAVGATNYMLAYSSALRSAVSRLIRERENWTPNRTFLLEAFMRFCVNDEFAKQLGAHYIPAVARAEIVREQNRLMYDYIITSLEQTVDSVVNRLRESPLVLPAISSALIHKSRGRPLDVLNVAFEMRCNAAPFRDWMRSTWQKSLKTGDTYVVDKKLTDIRRELEIALGLEKMPRIRDAFDVTVVPLPSVRVNVGKLSDAIKTRWTSGKLAVLTEISRAAAAFKEEPMYDRLLRNSSRRLTN